VKLVLLEKRVKKGVLDKKERLVLLVIRVLQGFRVRKVKRVRMAILEKEVRRVMMVFKGKLVRRVILAYRVFKDKKDELALQDPQVKMAIMGPLVLKEILVLQG